MSTQKFTIEIEQEQDQRWIAEVLELLAPGPSELDLWIDVVEPRLWWPWDLGEQNLYSLDLSIGKGERILDRVTDRIGLRQVRTEPGSSAIHVNGTRVFCRGPNYVSDQLQSNMTRD